MKVGEACVRFLDYCRYERHLSKNTLAAYGQDLGEFREFFPDRLVSAISGKDLIRYARHLSKTRRLAPASVRRRLACLRAMFAKLARRHDLDVDPFTATDLKIRLPTRLPRCLTAAEVKGLLLSSAPYSTVHTAVLLLVVTGVRIGELAAIRIGALDLDQRSIRIFGKGSRERQVFLPDDSVVGALRGYIEKHHRGRRSLDRNLLLNRSGRPATAASLRYQIAAAAQRAGLGRRVTPHMLRHTAATALIEAGVDIRFVQRLLGHRSIATTEIYTHVSDRSLKGAVVSANVCRTIAAADSSAS